MSDNNNQNKTLEIVMMGTNFTARRDLISRIYNYIRVISDSFNFFLVISTDKHEK